ncbi:parallel beta-helix repeat (two copies) [Synechococcus sp. PCC 7502]|uniref:DUF1565 domain-containing protein n=1 Tax=Synechococcus sp. PCC 7502 TaxID=1173263 RepID=UPI00029FAFF9|nr:DUF1565 domain-containing protein [Synechococcus sp. PCC 7502]AFY73386.1 parallel beta-helix repeat (two copies) [Synechococcus sp. PCC 7502]
MLKHISTGVLISLFLGGVNGVSAQTKTLIRNQPVVPKLNIIYVNPVTGNDRTGKGSIAAPFRSITYALAEAKYATIIKLRAGTYTIANGEIFPLQLKAGVIVEGNESKQGQDTVILGGGNFLSPTLTAQNITVLGANFAELRGVTITNKNPRGYGLWLEGTSPRILSNTFSGNTQDGILILGKSAAVISKNVFITNGANGMSIEGEAQPEISSNRFENTGYGLIIRQNAAPRIVSNVLRNNRSGILIQPSSTPIIRNNLIEGNRQTGITILGNSSPDLGNADSLGNNRIRNNLLRDVQYTGTEAIAAVGNEISRLSGNIQLSGTLQSQPLSVPNISSAPNVSPNLPNGVTRTIIPNSVIVRTLPIESTQPLPLNTKIDPTLPPIALTPPTGVPIKSPDKPTGLNNPNPTILPPPSSSSGTNSRTIIITRAKPTAPVTLRYRVVVSANSESSKLEIRRIVPTAFTARMNGQEVIQVGAFSDRTAADEQVKILAQAGFNAEVESIGGQ